MSQFIYPAQDRKWWKEAVIYQIYPSSFCDSNGDGIGDLAGITSKVPYLASLGVNVIWLCPIYDSPQYDMGYDISDYRNIYKPYGSMEDFDNLLETVHKHGMKLVQDLVVNHSSSEHQWFKESKADKASDKRDYYVWHAGKKGADGKREPPNNWRSVFGTGSAWEWDESTQEYYLHLFLDSQPDLNWENPKLREEVYDLMRFWLDKGIDGFRMDVINMISKTPGFPDARIQQEDEPYQPSYELTTNGPRVHEFIREMNDKVLSKYDILTVGECPFTHDPNVLLKYVQADRKELQMVFHFEMHDLDGRVDMPLLPKAWKLSELKRIVAKWQNAMEEGNGWNSIYFENHDQARSVSRLASDAPEYRALSAKLLQILQLSLCGTIYIYQGQDFGQINVPSRWGVEEYKDVATVQYLKSVKAKRAAASGEENPDISDVLMAVRKKARDNARTPMHWDDSKHAGFTSGDEPWMNVHDDFKEWNVAKQVNDPDSVVSFLKKMIKLRVDHPVLVYGNFKLLSANDETVFAYTRQEGSDSVLVVLNFSGGKITYDVPSDVKTSSSKLLVANADVSSSIENSKVALGPWEAAIYTL